MIRVGENVGDDVLIACISGEVGCPCCAAAWPRSSFGGAVDLRRGRLLRWEPNGTALVQLDKVEQTMVGTPDGLWPGWMAEEAGVELANRSAAFGVPSPVGRVRPPACPVVAWASRPGWFPSRVRVEAWECSHDAPTLKARVREDSQDDSDAWLVESVYWTEADAQADR